MGIILDADVVINAERRTFDIQSWMRTLPDEAFELAAITVAELWHGLERASGAHRAHRSTYLQGILSALPIISYTEQTALEHARLGAELESAGTMIGLHDLMVAATALERNSAVATFNVRHFSMVRGLTVIQPARPI
jgi:tRNA(fMet)-specific endonuclease VapC